MIFRKWHTVGEVAAMLGYGLTKTKMLIITVAPATASAYDMFARLYINPGHRRLDKLSVRDGQTWLARLCDRCQCCAQGKDLARPDPRCCAGLGWPCRSCGTARSRSR